VQPIASGSWLSFIVEIAVPRIHAGATDRFDLFLRQLGPGEAAAAFAEALELLIFIGTDEIAGISPWLDTATASRWARMR
jgi:hypothetical protein